MSLAIGVIVVAIVFMFFSYQREVNERDLLTVNVSAAEKIVPQILSQKQVLEAKKVQLQDSLSQAKSAVDVTSASFHFPLESIEYGEEFSAIASRNNLQIIAFIASEPTEEKKDNVTYLNMAMSLDAVGKLNDVANFISSVFSNDNFSGVSVRSLNISGMDQVQCHLHMVLLGQKYKG